jgi:RNA-directed DNA polymerase
MVHRRHLAKGLAFAFLAGAWTEGELLARALEALGDGPSTPEGVRWLQELVRRVMRTFPAAPIGREDDLAELLAGVMAWPLAEEDGAEDQEETLSPTLSPSNGEREKEPQLPPPRGEALRIRRWLISEATMVPVGGAPARFRVFPMASSGELAAALGLRQEELDWFADAQRLNARANSPKLSHYHHHWVAKARGGWRLLEAPKARLKRMQRWLLDNVVAPIQPSDVAHGFVQGRSVRTFVAPHVGRPVVVRMDLEDFFASVSRARVVALFRRVGYPRPVAAALAGLCTAPTPEAVLAAHPREAVDLAQRFLMNARLRDAHLPQGAPTSPALSNLAAWRLDRRVAGLAAGFGATMTRYADDLAFSGDEAFGRSLRFFLARVGAIALEEGFRVNHRKTRVMRQGRRQSLCGLVVNDTANLPRRERDRLRATLFNAARSGLDSQNRDARPDFRRHLEGRVAWAAALNPAFGRRAKGMLGRVSAETPE